jgi:hypothetical protein
MTIIVLRYSDVGVVLPGEPRAVYSSRVQPRIRRHDQATCMKPLFRRPNHSVQLENPVFIPISDWDDSEGFRS